MRRNYVISLVLVMIFILPMGANDNTSLAPDTSNFESRDSMNDYVSSSDPYSGTGPSLPVSLSGVATDNYGGALQIDASTSDIHTITLADGWSGSNLQTTIDTLSIDITDALTNPTWNPTHLEKIFVGSTSGWGTDVRIPNGWSVLKTETNGDAHPNHGAWEVNDVGGSGYTGDYGFRFDADIPSGLTNVPNDEVCLSQLVNVPFREIYSVDVSFRYNVITTGYTSSQMYLFARFNGVEKPFYVFESGDTRDTWLQATASFTVTDLQSVTLPDALNLEVGMGTDLSGSGVTLLVQAYIDEIDFTMNVRPYPEQIDLKVNGAAVVGATLDSVYPYEPDNNTRDAWDDYNTGLDLSGNPYSAGDGDLDLYVYSATYDDWPNAETYQCGIQFPVNIPQGAVITSAYFEVEPTTTTGNPTMRIYAAGFSSSGTPVEPFTSGLPHLEDRMTWVDSSIDWDPRWGSSTRTWDSSIRIRHRSPEIAPLIQSIVSEDNWTTGNYISIMLDYMWSSHSQDYCGFKGAYGATYSQDELPRFFVEYMIPEAEDTVYFMQYEKDITIDHTQVAATLTDFPVLIDIIDTDLHTDVQADGDDIIFKLGDEALDFEIELFDQDYSGTEAHLVAWVKVPTLSSTQDTIITMAYGNPDAASSSSTSVWDDYETVNHMNDDPSGTVYDSTSNNHDGTAYGIMGSEDSVSGLVGGGIDFDGSGTQDMISIGQIYTDDWAEVTVSIWIKSDLTKDSRVFSKSPSTTTTEHIVTIRTDTSNRMTARIRTDYGGTSTNSNTTFTLGSWYLMTWSWSASSGYILGYINGVPVIQTARSGNNLYDSNDVFVIGNTDMTNDRYFDGVLDEARLANRVLSADWIATEYNNQVNPSAFASVSSSERTIQSTWTDAESTTVRFSTTSIAPVDILPIVTMDITAGGQTLDENMQDGTSFYVANDTVVEWTANVLVSPPADTASMNVRVDYPITEWKPVTVTNPIGQVKTYGTDWTFHDGVVELLADGVDIWGVWTIEFESWNYAYDMKLGPNGDSSYDTYTFNIGNTAEFKVSTPWVENARTGLVLTDPTGSVWHSDYATSGTPGTTWDVPSFSYRMQLSVPAAQVDVDVTNFPMLVSFADTDFQTDVQADGDDFIFVQNNIVLAHEIDRFDQSTGRLVAYVRANLSSTVDNTLWLYYGNPVIGSCESPETLWSDNYEAVWLLNEYYTDDGSTGYYYDSTSNGYIGNRNGTSQTSDLVNGFAQNFDGNDYITINSTEGLDPTGDVTISGWFYIADTWSSTSTPSRLLVSKYLDGDNNFHIALSGSEYTETGFTAHGSLVFGFENSNGEFLKWTTKTSWTAGWYHFACVMDSDTPANNLIYINGEDYTDTGYSGGATSINLAFNADWGIGGRYVETSEFPSGEAFHTGRIDDLMIASTQRTAGWFNVTYDNWVNLGPFIVEGTEQTRTSPEHTIDKLIDSTAPAGLWTASFYYNDTGASVSYATGLYERNFIVKHDTSLSIVYPTDAIVDHSTYAVAGDIVYIELELTDDVNAATVAGATVTMNWSIYGTPTELTLNDIGNGRYGKSVDTNELGDEGQYRVDFTSDHQYYNAATDYLIIDLYHATELDYTDVDTTPVGFDFTATLIFEDTYDFSPITGATITFQNGTAVSFVDIGGGHYNITFSSGSLGYGDHVYTFRATKAGSYLEDSEVTVTFTIRKHFTTTSVIGDLVTPYEMSTDLTIVIIDTDTGGTLTVSNVASFLLDPATGGYSNHQESSPSDLIVSLDTTNWVVGTESVTLTVTMNGIYNSPEPYVFGIQIRNHYTSVTVIGDLVTPYGDTTILTLVITDTDTGGTLTSASVTSFTFTPSSYGAQSDPSPSDLIFVLDTSTWSVTASETVTLSVVMSGNYDNPTNYDFDIEIRNHYTSVTVIGDFVTPYGQSTTVTLVITDTDTGSTLTAAAVSSFTFTPSSYGAQSDPSPSDLIFVLDTSAWSVTASETVTLSVVMSGNYDNPTSYDFDIEIRNHYTSVTVSGDLVTPYGQQTVLTIVLTDTDTGLPLAASDISSFTFASSYGSPGESTPADLVYSLNTGTWSVSTVPVTLSVVMTGNFENPTNYVFNIQIRNHYTSVSVTGDFVTPYGEQTSLTIIIRDSDTGAYLSASDVSSFAVASSYGSPGESTPADLLYTLDTSAWSVSTVPVTLSVVMSGNYDNPQNFQFDIQIRNRRTSVTVIGNFETPYGNITPLTIVLTDVDDGSTLSASDIASFTFASSYGSPGELTPGDLFYDLDTSTWLVGGETVTLSIVMAGNYQNPTNYVFTITIRSMTTAIANEPNDLRFPTGADFKIVVVVNVSQQGSFYGDPVTGLLQAEFTIRNSTHIIPIKEFYDLSNGRYNLTVDASYFPEGVYAIYIRVNPTDDIYASCQMTLIFEYTPARSELSSPDRAAVTPYDTDFVVTLTYLDIDRDTGITGAIITSMGITIYNQVELGNGVYQVTVDVSGLAKGDHLYNLTADQIGYDAQTISFKVVIRIAFTYAIPTVGALDIPVGDDPVFYVEYWDIDHDLPIDDTGLFSATSTWIHSVTFTYVPSEQRYRVTFFTNEDDTLRQNYIVSFNFSKGDNYQFGLFNISITIRTHNTDFRLTSAVEPVTYTNNITISVFYGDLDSGTGIASQYVSFRVWNGTVNVVAYLYNVTGQGGYYTIIVPAQQFGGLGLQNFTIFFNWTGPVSTYSNKYLVTSANILGEDSRLSLLVTAEPTPYLEEMEYTLFYSAVNGTGISNITNHVYILVEFVGESVDLGQVTIWEVNALTAPGEYSIRFNTTLFGKTGLIYMKVYINWAKGVEPYFSNRTDTISVRILPRDTLVSLNAPIQTPYNVNATFSFTFDDVTGTLNEPIANSANLFVVTSLSDYSIYYDGPSKTFTISFNTAQFGALGTQAFTLSVTWIGAPFYANQTGRSVSVKVITRQTLLDYQAPSPTQYLDNVTFTVTWTDVAEASAGIESAVITLYDGAIPISSTYYTVTDLGSGIYSVELNTTYKASPGTYIIKVNITSGNFYYLSREDTRSLTIRYRSTITSSEPVNAVPYSSSFTVILYYQDIITLDVIGNTSTLVSFDILNGSSWIYTITWKESLGYYELVVETSNQPSLSVGSTYLLRINMSYASTSPFYGADDTYISFEIRSRASSLERETAPVPMPYLELIPFTVYYSDADDSSPITTATISVYKGATPLINGLNYTYSHTGGGVYQIYVRTTALDGLGVTTITVYALWTGGAPYHDDASINIDLTVTRRSTNVEIVTPPSPTNYLEDVVFVVSFIDLGTGTEVAATKDLVTILNGGVPLAPALFTFTEIGTTQTYEITINSSDLDANLVINRILTISIDWPDTPNYYKDDSTSTSVTTIARNTYVSVDRPGNTPYGENATFTFTFIDSTTLPENLIALAGEMSIVTNLTETPFLSYDVASKIFTMSFNTSQFGNVGLAGFYINITWSGTPFYANKTLQIVFVTVTMRQTQLDFSAPAPTPYGDTVTFDVSYIDISGSTDVRIPDASLTIYYLGVPVPGANYVVTPDGAGNFEIQFDTDFFSQPGYYNLNVSLVYTGGYFREDASATRILNVRYRTTILSSNPVGQVGYETTLEITLTFQDILTLADIDDTYTSFEILNDTGTPWVYSLTWRPGTSDYLLSITTVGQTTLTLGDHSLWLNMSYASVAPFYRWDDLYVEFTIRTRTSALDLQEAAIPAPYQENISFVVYYWDADVTEGISGADFILNSSALTEGVDFFVVDGSPGVYTIYIDSSVLGGLGTYSIVVEAIWPGGAPYHNNAQRTVSVSTVRRTATVEILEPANQPRYLDNLLFTLAFVDSINGLQINIPTTYVSVYAGGSLLTQGVDYAISPIGSTFLITINSTVLSSTLVSNYNVTVMVDWNDVMSPFYVDDTTSMKVTTTQRIILVEPQQIETTPRGDLMNISFILTDEDNGNWVSTEIPLILFRCVNPYNDIEGFYTIVEVTPGHYTISLGTSILVDTIDELGDFIFELEIQWNPTSQPFYRNKTAISLTGSVDRILLNIQSGVPTPSPVEITANVTIQITLTDVDHNLGVSIPTNQIFVTYYGTSIIPSPMNIDYLGSGVYKIEFSTIDLNSTGTYSVNISANYGYYTAVKVNPSFTVTAISTTIEPVESDILLYWTEIADVRVDFIDLLHLNLTSGATLNWTYLSFNGTFDETTTLGRYNSSIDTTQFSIGTHPIQIRAYKDKFTVGIITVRLIVLSLASDLEIDSPGISYSLPRGTPLQIVVYLKDMYNGGIPVVSGVNNVTMFFEGEKYFLTHNSTHPMYWYVELPAQATYGLIPDLTYSARLNASSQYYDPASAVIKIYLEATATTIHLASPTQSRMDVVYNEIITFYLNYTETANVSNVITNATIRWVEAGFGINETFTYNPISGLWELSFNTSRLSYGTWGLTFDGIPGDSNLAEDRVDLAITIKKITTEVIRPIIGDIYWGWVGNITFFYNDTYFDRGIENATTSFSWGPFTGQAVELGGGYYSILINTTYLDSGIRYTVTIDFTKPNYQVSGSSISLFVEEVPTEVQLFTPTDNQIDSEVDHLKIPFGDSITISFFYNDTDNSDGYVGGLAGATITGVIFGGDLATGITFEIIDSGNGTYYFIFDSTASELFQNGEPRVLPDTSPPYTISIEIQLAHRHGFAFQNALTLQISIIERPTTIEFFSNNVGPNGEAEMYSGGEITIEINFYENWLDIAGDGVTGASFIVEPRRPYTDIDIQYDNSTPPGVYRFTIRVTAPLVALVTEDTIYDFTIKCTRANFETQELDLSITVHFTEGQKTMSTVVTYATPTFLILLLLAVAWTRHFSIPKRLRQINSQIKKLKKGKIPKAIDDAKTRQQLIAELFNDTYQKFEITRVASEMPEASIPIEVPEIRELLIQLSILTNLNQQELDEFNADISKMKMSEQAAFVKEVIVQEAIRAARRDGKTVEEVLEDVALQASRKISAPDEEEEVAPEVEEEAEERVFLVEDEEEVETEILEPEEVEETPSEEEIVRTEKLSAFEIEELRSDLLKKGVPAHEIDMIVEQARHLSRELVDELIKSLGLNDSEK